MGAIGERGCRRSSGSAASSSWFFQDENPPHVHIKGPDFAAKMRISNGDLLAGDAPNRVVKQARRWVEAHQAELLERWDELQR
jgi:hypothetical protein